MPTSETLIRVKTSASASPVESLS